MASSSTPTKGGSRGYVFKPRVCVCGDDSCADLMREVAALNGPLVGYFSVPSLPKAEVKRKRRPTAEFAAAAKAKQREAAFRHLKVGPNDRGAILVSFVASIHYPPAVLDLCTIRESGQPQLPETVSLALGQNLNKDCVVSYTDRDRVLLRAGDLGDFVPAPNYVLSRARSDLQRLKALQLIQVGLGGSGGKGARRSGEGAASASCGAAGMLVSPPPRLQERREAAGAKASPDDMGRRVAALLELVAKQEKALVLAHGRAVAAEQRAKDAEQDKDAQVEKDIDPWWVEEGGMSRGTLCDDQWHAGHPKAANHLFGFRDWKETKLYMWALFELEPPLTRMGVRTFMTDFEQCLCTKMRMHRGFRMETLACMWGRNAGVVGTYVSKWAQQWGEAGEDLSILNITAEFLDETCPDSYKSEGMTKVSAVPDGKDFKMHTPRANTVITRAARSSKVEATAARCISWGTPSGLSFEHTDLFLARCSEKKLVELWGPRLKKCPPGYSMLSDRGFAGTAHYYPNFNAQITPKFLAGRLQFTSAEVGSDQRICKLRYTCEVAFSRVTNEAGLQDVIPYHFFSILNAMNHWGHANVNLHEPLTT